MRRAASIALAMGISGMMAPAWAQSGATDAESLESAVFDGINQVRRDPAAYARWINGNRGRLPYQPQGKATLGEAIRVLKATKPLPQVMFQSGLQRAARDQVADQLPTGTFDHTGTDGSDPVVRMNRYGRVDGSAGEIAAIFSHATAATMVLGWVIDDGDSKRGHRKTMLSRHLGYAGVGCGNYPPSPNLPGVTLTLCVADFAQTFAPR